MSTVSREKENAGILSGIFRWIPAAWLRVTGEDAFTYLQGQFTNDLRALAAGPVYGLWLNQKGRVLADSFVVAGGPQEYWIGSYFSPAATIQERLNAYIVADDVTTEDVTSSWRGVTVFAAAPQTAPAGPQGSLALPSRRGAGVVAEWVSAVHASSVDDGLAGLVKLPGAEVERRRILARIPAVPMDLGPGDLPNEGGLENGAISATKGCYLGQEVIARLRSMGQVRRRLFSVRGSGPLPAAPCPLFQGDRKVGELRSTAPDGDGYVALALLTLLNLRPEQPLGLAPGGTEVSMMEG